MLKPERMKKVTVTAPKTFMEKAIGELYSLNAVHIIDHTKSELDIGEPLEAAEKISETLVSIRSLISSLNLSGEMELSNGFRAIGVRNFAQLAKTARELQSEANEKLDRIRQADDEAKALEAKKNILAQLEKLGLSLETYEGYSTIDVFTGHVKDAELLAKEIARKTGEYELYQAKSGTSSVIALFTPKYLHPQITETLAAQGFSELQLAPIAGSRGKPEQAMAEIAARQEKLLNSKNAAQQQLGKTAKRWHDFLLLSEQFLSIELEKAEAPLRMASSSSIFVLTGWVPEKNVAKLQERLEKAAKGSIDIEIEEPGHEDNIPVKLANNRLAKPFEFLMNLYALPKYHEIDPTIFLFLTFPLFFGIILGDVGYGAVVALLAIYIRKKFPAAAMLTKVIMPAAISSVFFGLLFGEVFGFEELFGYHIPHVISRVHQIEEMLYLSVAIGLLHVNIGLLLGFINELEHGLKKAILAKGSWWLLQLSVASIAATKLGVMNIPMYASAAAAVLAMIMILLGESITGLIEIPALLSNILSYSRLMAVGLASVGLAIVVNGFIEDFMHAGGIMIIPAIIIGILGHGLNIALGILGGFLHSIRLHYVEFFTKFFKGGAVPFQAFGKRTEEVN